MAVEVGLYQIASKKESMGICFVGKREFQDFISEVKEMCFSHLMPIASEMKDETRR